MAEKKDIIEPRCIRKITNSFLWVDHRVITGGFLDDLSTVAIALYFFLMAVSDRHGVSFYRDDRICSILKIGLYSLGKERAELIARSLIVYRYPVYQVLALPEKPITPPSAEKLVQEKKKEGLTLPSKDQNSYIRYAGQRVRGLWRYLFRQGMILEPPRKKKQLPGIKAGPL